MPPPGEESKVNERKRGNFQSIGRLGLVRDDGPDLAPVNKAGMKKRFAFDPSEGRDYAADAEPAVRPASKESRESRGKKEKENDYKPPVVKSPAEVAAEKAAEWKRQ